MDRQYIIKNDIAEKYLLGKLDLAEQAAYETFLKQDEESRDELEMHKLLIGGLRAAGRDEMKRDMRRQVGMLRSAESMSDIASAAGEAKQHDVKLEILQPRSKPQSDFNSSMILRIAAVLFILVCAPLLYKYYQANSASPEMPKALSDVQQAAEMTSQDNEEFDKRDDAAFAADAIGEEGENESGSFGRAGGNPAEDAGQDRDLAATPPQPAEKIAAPSRRVGELAGESNSPVAAPAPIVAGNTAGDVLRGKKKSGSVLKEELAATIPEREGKPLAPGKPPEKTRETTALQDAFAGTRESRQQEGAGAAAPVASLTAPAGGDYLAYRSDPQPAAKSEAQEYKMRQNVLQYNSSERSRFALPQFRFSAGEQVIYVAYQLMRRVASGSRYESDGFPVLIRRDDKGQLYMDWQVSEAFYNYPLSDIELRKFSDSELRIVIRDSLTYRVDLKQDSTEAVLVRP